MSCPVCGFDTDKTVCPQCSGARPGSFVRIPTSADEAALMVILGTQYLERFAPQRLKTTDARLAEAKRLLREIASQARNDVYKYTIVVKERLERIDAFLTENKG